MTPRSSAAILLDIEGAKLAFDARHFKGHNLTTDYKKSLAISWQLLQVQVAPLLKELHEAEALERATAKARCFTYSENKQAYYVAKYARKAG